MRIGKYLLLITFFVSIIALQSNFVTSAPDGSNIIITEVLYDAPNSDTTEEWVELFNPTGSAISLSGWVIADNYASFALSGTIAANGYFTITRDNTAFQALYGYTADLDGMTLALGNSGDQVVLKDASATEIDFVAWENYVSGWSVSAVDGTIARIDITDTDTVNDWEATGTIGEPGTGSYAPPVNVIISEVLYDAPNSDTTEEWIELYNPGSLAISLDGWSVSDNYATFYLSGSIAGNGYYVIAIDSMAFQNLYGISANIYGSNLALSNSGDQVVLKDASGVEMDFIAWENFILGWSVSAVDSTIRRISATDTDTVVDWEDSGTIGDPGTGSYSGGGDPIPDTIAPTVSINNPNAGATIANTVSISFSATDVYGISSTKLFIDGALVSTSTNYNWDTTFYSDSTHVIRAEATDPSSNTGFDEITVTVDNSNPPPPPPPPGDRFTGYEGVLYTGQLHNHANEYGDDGSGSIASNLQYMSGTTTPNFDFGGLSPHSHMVSYTDMFSYWNQMNNYQTSTFITIPGQEWSTLSSTNHVNIYYADEKCEVANGDIPGYYNWLITSNGYGSFNHPWDSSGSDMNNWQYYEIADKPGNYAGKMVMMEMKQSSGDSSSFADYIEALNNGWHIGITVHDDNHDGDPGSKYTNRPRTGMWLTELTDFGVEKAFQELRFFGTQEVNGYVDLYAGGHTMGDIFSGTTGMTLYAMLNPAFSYSSVELYIDGISYNMNQLNSSHFTYTINGAEDHYYFVRAKVSTTNSYIISSPMWSEVGTNPPPPDTTPPTKVSGLTAITTGTTTIDLSWTANSESDLDHYKIYRDGIFLNSVTTTSYSDSGLSESTTYDYQVSAVDTSGNEGVKSDISSATTQTSVDTTAPVKVTGLIAISMGTNTIELSWNANSDSDLDYYNIYRDGVFVTSVTTTSYSDSGLTEETTYSYQISAVDTSGNEGILSDIASATTDTPVQSSTMHVQSLNMWCVYGKKISLFVEVVIVDQDGNPVVGASVTVDLLGGRRPATLNGVTDTNGRVIWELSNMKSGDKFTAVVTDVICDGYVYDPSQNLITTKEIII